MNALLRLLARDQSAFGMIGRKVLPSFPWITRSLGLRERLLLRTMPRIYYAYCLVRASEMALRLGYREVSAVEFGVAGGNGLVALEQIKDIVEQYLDIRISIFGFDLGSGLPSPVDYRDLPYHWQGGFYEMDVERLRSRLKKAELLLGPVSETVPAFLSQPPVDAPVGMISFDLDYYSSTVEAFRIFEIDRAAILPRVMCYMDDITGVAECYSDYTGERLAIAEFNESHARQKLSPCYDFADFPIERWQEKIMIYHDFMHPLYNSYVGDRASDAQLPLDVS